MATLVVLSSVLKFFVAARLSLFRRIITPVVSGTVLMLIAATVILAVFGILTEVPDGKSVSPLAAPLASVVTLGVIAFMLLRAPRPLQIWAPLIGIVTGSLVSLPFGLYDVELVQRVHWIGISPEVWSVWPGFDFTPGFKFWALLPAFLLIMVITSFKAIADTSAIQRVSRRQPRASDFRLIQGGLHINALSNLASGLAGTMPTMTASPRCGDGQSHKDRIAQRGGMGGRHIHRYGPGAEDDSAAGGGAFSRGCGVHNDNYGAGVRRGCANRYSGRDRPPQGGSCGSFLLGRHGLPRIRQSSRTC